MLRKAIIFPKDHTFNMEKSHFVDCFASKFNEETGDWNGEEEYAIFKPITNDVFAGYQYGSLNGVIMASLTEHIHVVIEVKASSWSFERYGHPNGFVEATDPETLMKDRYAFQLTYHGNGDATVEDIDTVLAEDRIMSYFQQINSWVFNLKAKVHANLSMLPYERWYFKDGPEKETFLIYEPEPGVSISYGSDGPVKETSEDNSARYRMNFITTDNPTSDVFIVRKERYRAKVDTLFGLHSHYRLKPLLEAYLDSPWGYE